MHTHTSYGAVGIRFAENVAAANAVELRANAAVVETEAPLRYGTRVTVVLPSNVEVEGIVRWSSERRVGIQFDRPRPRALHALHRLIHH